MVAVAFLVQILSIGFSPKHPSLKSIFTAAPGSLCTGLEEIKALILLSPHQSHMLWKPTWPKWINWYLNLILPLLCHNLYLKSLQLQVKHLINELLAQKKTINNDALEQINQHIETRIHQRIDSVKIESTALFFWKTVLYSTLNVLNHEDLTLLNMSSARFNLPKFCSFFEDRQLMKARISPELQRQLESESPIQFYGEKHIIRNCRI